MEKWEDGIVHQNASNASKRILLTMRNILVCESLLFLDESGKGHPCQKRAFILLKFEVIFNSNIFSRWHKVVMSIGNQKFGIPRKYQYQIGIWYFCLKFLGISSYFIGILSTIFLKFG